MHAERLFDEGSTVVDVPMVESIEHLAGELSSCGVQMMRMLPPNVDPRAVRVRKGLSQEQFASEFGLDLSTVRNWEQGRSEPDTASKSYLVMIDRIPDAVRFALAEETSTPARSPAI